MADERHPDWITAELRRTAVTERAPTHLRLQIDELAQRRHRRPARRRVLAGTAGLLAAVLLALVLVLPGGTPAGPTVAQAAVLGAQPITYSPLAITAASQTKAYARFADVRFPRQLAGRHWTFEAYRIARLDGRQILTLYYSHGDQEIAYLVVATPRLRGQRSGVTRFQLGGRMVVSWQESNHSCLLTSATVPASTLMGMARS